MDDKLNIGTIWLTGLAASGKSTLSEKLYQDLLDYGVKNVVLLDGEAVREQLKNFDYDTNDRNAVGIQKAKLALAHNKKGKIAIITGIAHHRETRERIREMFDCYSEVYLKCSAQDCAKRDYKDHYRRALAGEYENFVGVTEEYEESNPDLVLDTANESIDQCAKKLFEHVLVILKAPSLI